MSAPITAWVDGRMVDPDAPALPAIDHGITVGDGVFETCKVEDGRAFALTRHLRRLHRSATGLGLPAPDEALLREGVDAVLSAATVDGAPMPFGRLRFTMTGGPGPLGSDRTGNRPSYVVLATPLPRPPATTKVSVVPWPRNERSAVAGLKTTSYADNVVALAHALERGGSEALMANTRGELCEGTGSNVFVVVDGALLTPPLDSGCLAGITRELTIEWARAAGIEVREEVLPLDVLQTADEVAITSSTRDVQGVHAVDDRLLEAPGPVTQAAAKAFAVAAADRVDP